MLIEHEDLAPHLRLDLSDFELLEEIGRGGVGVVYRARQKSLERVVALKFLRYPSEGVALERFRREEAAAARLRHPHVVPIHSVGEHNGQPFYCMRYYSGGNMAERVDRFRSDWRRSAQVIAKLARGLESVHRAGVLHRDIKLSNILFDERDEPALSDFGLVRLKDQASELTRTGDFLGSPGFIAPEQATGDRRKVSERSDVYALGAVFYALLTGAPPISAATPAQALEKLLNYHKSLARPRDLDPTIPVDLEAIALQCLEKAPADRYGTAADLAADLEAWLEGREPSAAASRRRPRRTRSRIAGCVLLVVTLLCVLAVPRGTRWYRDAARLRAEAETLETLQLIARNTRQAWARRKSGETQGGAVAAALAKAEGAAGSYAAAYLRDLLEPTGRRAVPPLRTEAGTAGVAYSPAGDRIAVFAGTGVAVVDSKDGRLLFSPATGGEISAVRFSPDGSRLALLRRDDRVQLVDARSGATLRDLDGPWAGDALFFLGDGRRLAVNAWQSRVLDVMDVEGKAWREPLGMLCLDVAAATDGSRFAALVHDGGVVLQTPAVIASQHELSRYMLSQTSASRICVFDGERLEDLFGVTVPAPVCALALSEDGRLLGAANSHGYLRLWDDSGKPLGDPLSLPPGVLALALSANSESTNGPRVAALLEKGRVHVFEPRTGRRIDRQLESFDAVALAFRPGASELALVDRRGDLLRLDLGALGGNEQRDANRFDLVGRQSEALDHPPPRGTVERAPSRELRRRSRISDDPDAESVIHVLRSK